MNLTPHQAKYFAYELSKRVKSDSAEKFGATLLDAKVDLNPHQIQAALFAFKSPLSQGAILADEVGLGKTIEAGILLAQKWAEGSRRILIISPSSLRKQWMNELMDKFYLPSEVMETKVFNKRLKQGNKNPFENKEKIQPQVEAENIILNSFIISNTRYGDVHWKEELAPKDFHNENIYFQVEDSEIYIGEILKKVLK